jgi:hypothetical protein
MASLITAAARALAVRDPLGALNRVALRDDAPALASRHRDGAPRRPRTSEGFRAECSIACCETMALERKSAGRRWLERKAALLVTPESVHGGRRSGAVRFGAR